MNDRESISRTWCVVLYRWKYNHEIGFWSDESFVQIDEYATLYVTRHFTHMVC